VKIFILITIQILLCCQNTSAQKIDNDIQIVQTMNKETVEKIIDFLDVEYRKYSISKRLQQNYCNLIMDEYKKGILVKTINLREQIKDYENLLFISSNVVKDKFDIEIFSRKIADTTLKVKINIGGLGSQLKLKLIDSVEYSWKSITDISKKGFKINTNSTLQLLSYTCAIGEKFSNDADAFEFCRINDEKIPFTQWYNELGVEHFFIFSLRFEKK
jgi:hypothetical protein